MVKRTEYVERGALLAESHRKTWGSRGSRFRCYWEPNIEYLDVTYAGKRNASLCFYLNTIGIIRMATMFATLIIGLMAGPDVSLYGSPTVSPVMAAWCAGEPFPPWWPTSIYFLALSQAPPPEVIEIATNNRVTIVPTSTAPSITYPKNDAARTNTTGSSAGMIISFRAAFVTISTHFPYSGGSVPVTIPGLLCS